MTDQEQKEPASGFVFRVLNGSLNGIEFSLGIQDYFICVGDAGSQQENLAFAERTLYLPSNESKNNFIVNLQNQIDEQHFEVTVCYPTHQDVRNLALNTICEVEGVYFAVKREGEVWSSEVQKGLLPVPDLSTFDEGQASIGYVGEAKRTGSGLGRMVLALLCLAVLAGGSFFTWQQFYPAPAVSSVVSSQFHQLVGDRAGYSVHVGNNKLNYLFASTVQQADWAHQAVIRKDLTANWRVVTPQTEELRLAGILERNNIAFFAIRFADPGNPTLLLSSTRNETDEAALANITQLMLAAIPYAQKIHIALYSDNDVLNKAQQGLKALGFNYQTVQSDSGVTLSSWMPSVDVHLSEFGRFVSSFYQTWGQRYVHFSADMKDDLLKEKSYKYNDDGFITMNKSHWIFNGKQD